METAWALPLDHHPYSRPNFACCGHSGKSPKAFEFSVSALLHYDQILQEHVVNHKEDKDIKIQFLRCSRATPEAYWGSKARVESELQPDPQPTKQGQGLNPQPHGY